MLRQMQDRYAGDVGDFGKYGCLRQLLRAGQCDGLSLGVVWYKTRHEFQNNDGKHVGYLRADGDARRRFRECDCKLYDGLKVIVEGGRRKLRAIEDSGLLGDRVRFFGATLECGGGSRKQREARREAWVTAALSHIKDCDVVFLDPDNGVGPAPLKCSQRMAPKYAMLEECARFSLGGRRSIVVYQHADRTRPVEEQIRWNLRRLRTVSPRAGRPIALRFRRGTSRAFLVLPSKEHEDLFRARAREMVAGPWGKHKHFELIEP